jgi:hypothetical protein
MQDGVTLEGRRQGRQPYLVMDDAYVQGVAPAATVQADQAETGANEGVSQEPVLEVEEVGTATENLRLVLRLQTEALPQMHAAEALG